MNQKLPEPRPRTMWMDNPFPALMKEQFQQNLSQPSERERPDLEHEYICVCWLHDWRYISLNENTLK